MSNEKNTKSDEEIRNEVAKSMIFSKEGNLDEMCDSFDSIVKEWKEDELRIPEEAIKDLCTDKYKSQTDINGVIAKISIINQIYSTRVKNIDTYWLAKHITNNGEKLEKYIFSDNEKQRIEAVQIIANSKYSSEDLSDERISQMNDHYSFATKYCSFHNPDKFPIYDGYMCAIVKSNWNNLSKKIFKKKGDIENIEFYENFCESMGRLKEIFSKELGENISAKKFDQFLWLYLKNKIKLLKEQE